MKAFQALAIGDRPSGELCAALALLERTLPTVWLPTLSAATEGYSAGLEPPDLLVLFQSRAGQFLESDLLALRAWMPLARAVAVLGSWCEGEARSGQPLAGVRRVAWHLWPLRLERELAAWQSGGGAWSLPPTAAEEELLLAADRWATGPLPAERAIRQRPGLPLAVCSAHAEWAVCLVDALARRGRPGVALRPAQPALPSGFAGLVDDLSLPSRGTELARRYQAWLPRPIIALADFPRRQDERLLRAAGAAMLLGKPLDVDELAARLDQLLLSGA